MPATAAPSHISEHPPATEAFTSSFASIFFLGIVMRSLHGKQKKYHMVATTNVPTSYI
jgi:hypothetical protein